VAEIFIEEHEWRHIQITCECVPIRARAQRMRRQLPICVICHGHGTVPIRSVFPAVWRCACGAYNAGEGRNALKCDMCHKRRSTGPERSLRDHLRLKRERRN
jgi:hypothetical protein